MKAADPFSSPVVVAASVVFVVAVVVFVVVVVVDVVVVVVVVVVDVVVVGVAVVVVTGALLHARSCSIVDDRMLQEINSQTLVSFFKSPLETKLAMLAVKAYAGKSKLIQQKILPPVGIEPGTLGL